MADFIELENIILLDDGWFLDKATNKKFRVDDDGNVFDEQGSLIYASE